jgi:hypothetical protein
MIIAVALNKDSSKITFFHIFIIVFNVRLEYGLRKIIILMNNNFEKFFFSQRFVKKNDLISDLIKYIRESIDGYAVTIYEKHDLIIYIKDLEN